MSSSGASGFLTESAANATYALRAPAWITGRAYVLDELVTSGTSIYKVSTAHTSAGAFDATKFTAVGGGSDPLKLNALVRLHESRVMTSPPVITYTPGNVSPSFANQQTIAIPDARVLVSGGTMHVNSLGFYEATQSDGVSLNPAPVAQFSFETDAPIVAWRTSRDQHFSVLVDGERVSSGLLNGYRSQNSIYYTQLNFGSRKPRRIDIIGYVQLLDIKIATTDSLWRPHIPAGRPVLGVITDSYAAIPSVRESAMYSTIARRLGWQREFINGVGSSGYVGANSNTFLSRTAACVAQAPTILCYLGGVNDALSSQTQAQLTTAATNTFAAARTAGFTGIIVATGPYTPPGGGSGARNTLTRDAIKAGLATDPGPWLFIDPVSGGWTRSDGVTEAGSGAWITGTGKAPLSPPGLGYAGTVPTGGTLTAGTYYYVVTSTTAAGETSVSNEIAVTTTGSTSLNALDWDSVVGGAGGNLITGYRLYRGTSSGGQNVLIYSGTAQTFVDTGGAGTGATPPTSNTTGVFVSDGTSSALICIDTIHPSLDGGDVIAAELARCIAAAYPYLVTPG